jgi:hypothetical protein
MKNVLCESSVKTLYKEILHGDVEISLRDMEISL